MIKKAKALCLLLLFVGGTFLTDFNVKAQETPPTNGTCCPSPIAICIVGAYFFTGYFYKSSGDCPTTGGDGGGGSGEGPIGDDPIIT